MTSLIGFLILVSALTATSSALWCTECRSTSTKCSGDNITCPFGTKCGSIYLKTYVEGKVVSKQLIRECRHSLDCAFKGTESLEDGHLVMGISCCTTDHCTPDLPKFKKRSLNYNGLMCPTSWSRNPASCNTSDTVQCIRDENMCLLTTETTGLVPIGYRGCATKSFCDLGSLSYNAGGSSTKIIFTCTRAFTCGGISAHKVFLTPTIVCLLLLKLFL